MNIKKRTTSTINLVAYPIRSRGEPVSSGFVDCKYLHISSPFHVNAKGKKEYKSEHRVRFALRLLDGNFLTRPKLFTATWRHDWISPLDANWTLPSRGAGLKYGTSGLVSLASPATPTPPPPLPSYNGCLIDTKLPCSFGQTAISA